MAKYEQYAGYKDSGVEWLGEIPTHWEVTRAKFVSEIFVPQRNKPELNDKEGIPWATMEDMASTYIDETVFRVSDKAAMISGSKKLKSGAVIASCVGNFGVTSINTVDVIINQQLQAFVPTDIKAEYLREIVSISKSYFELIGTAATLIYVNKQGFENLPVLIPPKPEQTQITNFLDHETAQIDMLIEKQQTLIQLLKEKRQAVISHAVTKGLNPDAPMKDSGVEWLGDVPEHWEVWKFQHIAPIITCGIASTPTYVDEDEGMPFLSAQNIRDNKLSLHKYNYIPYQLHEQLTKHRRPEMGDLLVTRVGAGIGDACVINIEMEFSIYVSLTHIRVNPLIGLNKFVMYFFGSDYCKYLNYQGTVTGGGVGNLNVGNVERYKIPLPDLDEQANIVHYLETESDRFDSLIKKAEQAIQLMQERRTALISAAVTGKIDVRGFNKNLKV